MPVVTLVLDSAAVLAAIAPARAVELAAEAFRRHHAGEWEMPPKTYVDAPPDGDFAESAQPSATFICRQCGRPMCIVQIFTRGIAIRAPPS